MANLKTVIEIGGKIGSSLNSAFSSTNDKFKALGSSIKELNKTQFDIKNFAKAQSEADKAQKSLQSAIKGGDTKEIDKARQALVKKQEVVQSLGDKLKKAGVDTKNLSSEMERLAKSADHASKKLEVLQKAGEFKAAFKSAATSIALTGAAIGGALTAVGGGALALGQNVSNFIDDASDAAAGLGIDNVNNLLALQYAFADVGIEATETNALIAKFNMKVEESKDPASAAAKSLAQLGLTYQDFHDLQPDVQFQVLAEAIKRAPEGLNKTAFSMELLGKKGFKALAKLKEGAGFFTDAQKAAKEAGFEITKEMEETSDKNQKAFQKMSLGFRAAMNSIGSAYLPILTSTFETVTKFLGEHKEEIADIGSKIKRALEQALPVIIKFGTVFIGAVLGIISVVDSVVQAFGGWGTVMHALGDYMAFTFIKNLVLLAPSLWATVSASWAAAGGFGMMNGALTIMKGLIMTNPIGLLISLVLFGIYRLVTRWDDFNNGLKVTGEYFSGIWDWIKKIGSAVGSVFGFGDVGANQGKGIAGKSGASDLSTPKLAATNGTTQNNISNAPTINVQVATNADPHQIGNEVSRSFQSGVLATGSYHA